MESSPLSAVIHGHFYQPPRDDPWLETVEAQLSAEPYHDWNERIEEECYRAVIAARIPGAEGRIASILNTLEFISFNFGPTLLDWLEEKTPGTYRAILEADARSAARLGGHGNAIAQAYHHTILPLASQRDKVSEVRWGIADFRRRFGRDPHGMWLPETAVDGTTLDVLAQEEIAFTIVAPHQVKTPPPGGLPGLYRTPGGRSVALFVYNGPLSHGVAFGPLLKDADKWTLDVVGADPETQRLVSIATDGETYGHHHRFGEMALAAVIENLRIEFGVQVENFSSFLSRNPPEHEVELVELSSWSCAHGVERWRSDCGCKMDPSKDTQQEWRKGLRDALEWLASEIHRVFEAEGAAFFKDPWAARDNGGPRLETDADDPRALELLELERQALRLFTSCGWFFDDLAGIEPIQVLRYAAKALELLGPERETIENEFLDRLDLAVSNEDPPRTGRTIFLEEATPRIPAHLRVAAGAALWAAVVEGAKKPGPRAEGPGVPGYQTEVRPAGLVLVTHTRTNRQWLTETEVRRPSLGNGAVAVRCLSEDEPAVALTLDDLPEGFREPITLALREAVPDLDTALISAIELLGREGEGEGEPSEEQVRRVRDLSDLHILLGQPIPFDSQTIFFRILSEASPLVAERLAPLREPLGFTPA